MGATDKIMKRFLNTVLFLSVILAFVLSAPASTFAKGKSDTKQSTKSQYKCPIEKAKIYFSMPDATIASYNPEYYCSDIMYLNSLNKGNIPLAEYENLYPVEVQKNVSYLRKIGITPNLMDNISEEDYDNLTTPQLTDDFMRGLVSQMRGGNKYIITTYKQFEPSSDLFVGNSIGDILNEEKNYNSCSIIAEASPVIEDSLYTTSSEKSASTYRQLIRTMPPALTPIALNGNKFINAFGDTVAIVKDNRALGKGKRQITFSNIIFSKLYTTTIGWDEKTCRPNTLQEIVNRNSNCYLCPYIIMIFNEISYLFDYMYSHFAKIILIFIIVFGALWIVFEFFKGFKGLPFSADFSFYPKSITKKLQKILIVCTIFLVPPQTLFSWTVAPVLDLTVGISDAIMSSTQTEKTELDCNADSVVDELNAQRHDAQNDTPTPPIVKIAEQKSIDKLQDSYIIPKNTMGNIVCFLTNTLKANGRQMTMGEVLIKNLFDSSSHSSITNRLLGFTFGLIIFALYFSISLMISFYVLDGLLQFLLLAITWPFAVFGYAFDIVSIKVSAISLVNMAKTYGLILINLAVFSLFNSALLNSFTFMNIDNSVYESLQSSNLNIWNEKDRALMPFGNPAENAPITSEFGERSNPFLDEADIHANTEFHTGMDFAIPEGTSVATTSDGVVKQAGLRGNYGYAVEVEHNGGFSTIYGHLSKVSVSVGDKITAGTEIGLSGSTGRSTGPHLHYEVRYNGHILNPASFTTKPENITQILTRAIDENNPSIITDSIPMDLLSITKFLFIVYCIYYIYANLGQFAETYGGNAGSTPIGSAIRSLINSGISTMTKVSRTPAGPDYYVKEPKKDKDKKDKGNGKEKKSNNTKNENLTEGENA